MGDGINWVAEGHSSVMKPLITYGVRHRHIAPSENKRKCWATERDTRDGRGLFRRGRYVKVEAAMLDSHGKKPNRIAALERERKQQRNGGVDAHSEREGEKPKDFPDTDQIKWCSLPFNRKQMGLLSGEKKEELSLTFCPFLEGSIGNYWKTDTETFL